MGTSTTIMQQILRDEGFNPSAYPDSLGFWTVGSGICIDARKGCGITPAENLILVGNRIAIAQAQVAEQFPWTSALDPIRLAVLWNMTYEMGIDGLAEFRLFLAAVQAGNWQQASDQLISSELDREVPARAHREALQILTGEWQ